MEAKINEMENRKIIQNEKNSRKTKSVSLKTSIKSINL